jgi:tRNA-binding protein
MVTFTDFEKIDIRAGKIIAVEEFSRAKKPAYKLTIDFGEEIGMKRSSAQLTKLYSPADLKGKHIVAVVNFPPKNVAGFASEVLVLGLASEDGSVILLEPEREVRPGMKVS